MQPVVIIPTFIAGRRHRAGSNTIATYDHVTPLNDPGELGRCLASLEKVRGLGLIVVLVAAESPFEAQAAEKVQAVVDQHPSLNVLVIGAAELALVRQRMEQLKIGKLGREVALSGYGAVRNLGLVVANVFGFDAVVFLDDDEVVDDPDFLKHAMYGLGKLTRRAFPSWPRRATTSTMRARTSRSGRMPGTTASGSRGAHSTSGSARR